MQISWHARERMRERKVSDSQVKQAVERGSKRPGSDNTVECRCRGIKVVLSGNTVVTVCRER